jgi:hypothetical protein
MGLFRFFRRKPSSELLLDALCDKLNLTANQEQRVRELSNPGELIDIVAALPEELCHMQLAEVRPENGRYKLLINCRIVEDKKLVEKTVLPRALCYVICDLIGRKVGLDQLRLPSGIGLPIPGKGMSHMHFVLQLADSVAPIK